MDQNIVNLQTQELVDMLAKQTELYTTILAEKESVELTQLEYEIALIQGELNNRLQNTSEK